MQGDAVRQVEFAQQFLVGVNDHEVQPLLGEFATDEPTNPAEAAHDQVLLQSGQVSLHAPSLQNALHLAADNGPNHLARRPEEGEHASQQQDNREHPPFGGKRSGMFAIADGGERDDRHVQAVKGRRALDLDVADRADDHEHEG